MAVVPQAEGDLSKVKLTAPVGVKPVTVPPTVAVSWTTEPSGTSVAPPTLAWLASWIWVLIDSCALLTVSGSQEQIGRASCRERGEISVGGGSFKKKKGMAKGRRRP